MSDARLKLRTRKRKGDYEEGERLKRRELLMGEVSHWGREIDIGRNVGRGSLGTCEKGLRRENRGGEKVLGNL